MASCEFIGTNFAARVTYTVTQSVEKNQSVVKVTKVELKALSALGDAGFPVYLAGSITVNGVKTTTLALTDTTSCGISSLTTEYAGGGSNWSGFSTKSVTVYHEDDGTAKIPIKAILSVYMARGTGNVEIGSPINKTVNVSLPTIPRVSSMTASAVELGKNMSISISRAASSFRDTVEWKCGALSGTIATKTAETSLSWAVPLELANQAPSSTKATVTLTLSTYNGSTKIGSKSINLSCGIPEAMVPTLTVSVADKLEYAETYGGYIQGQSQAKVTTSASGSYGSTISKIEVSCGKLTGTGSDVSFALADSGQVTISATVTDSRGRTASAQAEITVLAYQKPSVAITDSYRCDENGNRKPDGAWMKIVFNARITALAGNTAAYTGSCTVHNTTQTRQEAITACSGIFQVTGGSFLTSAGIETAYDCRVITMDRFCTVESNPVLVSVAFALMDFCRDTKAVGIGMRAKTAEKLSIGLNTDMNEHGIENLPDPVGEKDAANKGYVDAAVRKAAPRNLLDNSDFRNPVNQRGKTSWNSNGYTIDRWVIYSTDESKRVVSIDSTGLTTAGGSALRQIVPAQITPKDKSKYTFAVCKTNGSILIIKNTWRDSNGNLVCAISEAGTYMWAALYEGEYTAETLPEYQPKGYAAELAECQRYYYTIHSDGSGYAAYATGTMKNASSAYFPIVFPIPMRIVPTLSYSGSFRVYVSGSGRPITDMGNNEPSRYSSRITVGNISSGVLGQACELQSNNDATAFIAFSADL